MIHDAATRRPPANVELLIGRELLAHPSDFLPETKGKRRIAPLVRRKRIAVEPGCVGAAGNRPPCSQRRHPCAWVERGTPCAEGRPAADVCNAGARLLGVGRSLATDDRPPAASYTGTDSPLCWPESGNCLRRTSTADAVLPPTSTVGISAALRRRIQRRIGSIPSPAAGHHLFPVLLTSACRRSSHWAPINSSRRSASVAASWQYARRGLVALRECRVGILFTLIGALLGA